MKRTLAGTIPLLALLMAAGPTSAQPLASDKVPLDAARQRYRSAEQRAMDAFQKLFNARQDGREIPPQELREKIRPLVEESFDARQRLQKAELETLRRRLSDIEQAIDSREKNKEAIVSSRIDEILSGKLSGAGADGPDKLDGPKTDGPDKAETFQAMGRLFGAAAADVRKSRLDEQREAPDFDLQTRERLAKLDLRAAEEDYALAEKNLSQARALNTQGSIPARELRAIEKEQNHAAVELERAKVKLGGLVNQRAALKANAEAAVDQASAEENKAAAQLATCEADLAETTARAVSAQAIVEKANATYQYRTKQYQRLKQLVEEKSVDSKLLDEEAEKLVSDKANHQSAEAELAAAMARVKRSKARIDEAKAEQEVAKALLRAAKAARDRLGRGKHEPAEPHE